MGGKSVGRLELLAVVENRTGAGSATTLADRRKFLGVPIRIEDECRNRRRQVFRTGIVRAVVARMSGIKSRADFFGFVVEIVIGKVVADEIRPAEIAGFASLIDFIVPPRSAVTVTLGIRSDFAPIDDAGCLIDRHAPWIPAAHAIDFRLGSGVSGWKQIALGDLIGAVGHRPDAQDFAAQVAGI